MTRRMLVLGYIFAPVLFVGGCLIGWFIRKAGE